PLLGAPSAAGRPGPMAPHRGRAGLAGGRRRAAVAALLLGLLPLPALAATAAGPGLTREYDLKAAFLFNFAHFVTWPPESFRDGHAPITIGVLGVDPFGRSLDEIVANESVSGRKLIVRRFQSLGPIDSCQILFVSSSESSRWSEILARLEHRSVLTVGDSGDFPARSGMVGFLVDHNRLRLRINLAAATAARLTISSKLLRLAETVGPARARECR